MGLCNTFRKQPRAMYEFFKVFFSIFCTRQNCSFYIQFPYKKTLKWGCLTVKAGILIVYEKVLFKQNIKTHSHRLKNGECACLCNQKCREKKGFRVGFFFVLYQLDFPLCWSFPGRRNSVLCVYLEYQEEECPPPFLVLLSLLKPC